MKETRTNTRRAAIRPGRKKESSANGVRGGGGGRVRGRTGGCARVRASPNCAGGVGRRRGRDLINLMSDGRKVRRGARGS